MKKIILITNTVSFFYTHRLNFYKYMSNKYNIYLIFGNNGHKKMEHTALNELKNLNINFDKIKFESSNISIFKEFLSLLEFYKNFKKINPHYIHAVSIKPIFICGILSLFFRKIKFIYAFSGLGYLFTEKQNLKSRILKNFLIFLLKIIFYLKKNIIIVQNNEDFYFLKNLLNISNKEIYLINGSGVDINYFKPNKKKKKEKIILFPSRLLKDKGFFEFINSAIQLKHLKEWRFVLLGAADYNNPNSISKNDIIKITKNENIYWYDYSNNIIDYYLKASIVCLPSYREGLSKSLIEASSCGCPIITTDVPGCRETVIHNKTGFLVKPRNVDSLTLHLSILMMDDYKRNLFSINARKYAIENFDEKIILNKFNKIYEKI